MYNFSKGIILFALPILLALCMVESFIVCYPNTFNLKAKYIHNHRDVELLVLGSSHSQNSINPEYLHVKAANLAYGGQDMQLDSALFFQYAYQLDSLKYVVLEMDYLTLGHINEESYFRLGMYNKFHDIDLHDNYTPILYLSAVQFFNEYIITTLNPNAYNYELSEYGFILNDFPGKFEELNFDSTKICKEERKKNRLLNYQIENFSFNKSKIEKIIKFCLKNQIEVILISNPVHACYAMMYEPTYDSIRKAYVTDLLNKYEEIYYFNHESANDFDIYDFKDSDHLNSNGAKRHTDMLNAKINSLNTLRKDAI